MNDTARALIEKNLFGKKEPSLPQIIESESWVYVLADGTGCNETLPKKNRTKNYVIHY
ncbi:MAG: hypothetical protein KA536_15735 [Saprospiraceae bacterium]|nr:hypothetical protein [Saprospiraceae bacterium]